MGCRRAWERRAGLITCLLHGLLLSVAAEADSPVPTHGQSATRPDEVVVLDTTGFWRMHHTLQPPVIESQGGAKAVVFKRRIQF